jgi:VanZ family protein
MRKNFLIFNLILIFIISVLNKLALVNFWFWKYWWYDIMMHFLGGLWVGMMFLWFFYFSNIFEKFDKSFLNIVFASILSVWIIGVGWEVFEVWADPQYFREGYVFDTVLDLIMDTLGAIIGGVIYYKFLSFKNNYAKI